MVSELSGNGCDAIYLQADLTEPQAPQEIVSAADSHFGRIDAVVNCAAATFRGSVWDTTAEMWDQMFALNLRAPGLVITAAAKVMKREAIEGTIVNIGSVAASGGQDFLYPYAPTKRGLQALTRNAAYSLMRHRIRVNLIQPGWMSTDGEDVIQRRFHGAGDDWLERAAAQLPFGRLIDPNELARTIWFLATPESGMMTGAIVDYDQSVDGAGEPPKPDGSPVWGEEES
jgi:NAD(P)-dependent dehydrogenase (short-subunit alcohol dehydrogenase family)